MKDKTRRRAARKVAEEYAPWPEGIAMYILVAITLAVIGLGVFADFYDVDMISLPIVYVPFILAIVAIAFFLRIIRKRRHNKAHRAEYDRPISKRPAAQEGSTPKDSK